MKTYCCLLAAWLIFFNGLSAMSNTPAPPSHAAWDALLKKHVGADGKVNYKGIKADKAKLEGYLKELSAQAPSDSWSRNEQLAYWINAYNAFTIKLIIDKYPVASIRDLHQGNPWDVKWIKLGDKTYSLNNIENDIIRPTFKEPRIHFAVNCAAKSCPPLLNRAWTADALETLLEQQAKAFINNPAFNKVESGKAQVSKIFEWYATDFGNLADYLNRYAKTKLKKGAPIQYLEYNWALNE